MIGMGYTFNNKAQRTQGWKGSVFTGGETRDICSYYADIVMKYRGFAFAADYLGRYTPQSALLSDGQHIYTGSGLNVQASYMFGRKWEVAVRNSTMFPDREIRSFEGYGRWNQSTLGVTRYIIGHSLKIQLDVSYNHMSDIIPAMAGYDRWGIRFQVELGL